MDDNADAAAFLTLQLSIYSDRSSPLSSSIHAFTGRTALPTDFTSNCRTDTKCQTNMCQQQLTQTI